MFQKKEANANTIVNTLKKIFENTKKYFLNFLNFLIYYEVSLFSDLVLIQVNIIFVYFTPVLHHL